MINAMGKNFLLVRGTTQTFCLAPSIDQSYLYMPACAIQFEQGVTGIHQILAVHRQGAALIAA